MLDARTVTACKDQPMSRPPSERIRLPIAVACLVLGLAVSACTGGTVLAPASAPAPDAKPALAAPPSSMMTPPAY